MPDNVCFTDIETTGLHPFIHHPWEVALITPDGDEHRWFLSPNLADADPISLEISGYHRRHPHGYATHPDILEEHVKDHWLTSPQEFAAEYAALTFGHHLAGAVISFDAERIAIVLRDHGYTPGWHYHLIDVEALAAGYVAATAENLHNLPDRYNQALSVAAPPWDSTTLSQAVGVEPGNYTRHTALGDCRWAKAIYRQVIPG